MASNRTPLATAATSAREKLQASAQNIWSSIRSFDDSGEHRGSSGSNPSDANSPTKMAASASLEKLESVIKVMFGSCTTGTTGIPRNNSHRSPVAGGNAGEPYTSSFGRRSSNKSSKSVETGPRQNDTVGHVYEQLFNDNPARAAAELRDLRQAPPSTSPNRTIPKPFAASNPTRPGLGSGVPSPTTRAVDVSHDSSFDDDISAISAHTLNEMARYHEFNKQHPRSTLDQRTGSGISFPPLSTHTRRSGAKARRDQQITALPPPPPPPPGPSMVSPISFARGRSHASANSKCTRSSRTTQSSQDSEFASEWRRHERKYWDDVAREDEKRNFSMNGTAKIHDKMRRRRSRCGSHSTKHDLTIATASSSSYSNLSSHPHDTYHFVPSKDNFLTDPSRIHHCLVVSHTSELAEI